MMMVVYALRAVVYARAWCACVRARSGVVVVVVVVGGGGGAGASRRVARAVDAVGVARRDDD